MYEGAAAEILRRLNHQIPCFPDHYDYEWHPQDPRSPSQIPWVIHKGCRSLQLTSGALSLSCAAYEPISARAVHEWFAEDGRDFFCVGVGTVDIGLGDNANASRPAGNEHLKGTGTVSEAENEMLKAAPVLAPGVTAEAVFSESEHVWAMISRLLDLEIPFRMGEELAKAWGEGGVSKETIKRFVQKFILNK
ncbi:hypothetical protein BU17DRAFT_71887 [Hysterangium stoloniferum]|nr:hypothetical protein BU17DRAFT_71887 [Hysterangium stoloniferum]